MLTNSFSNYAPSYTRLRGRPIFGEARKNFSDLTVGNQELKILGPLGSTINLATKGYGVDLDGDGKFQGDRDGVLAFDINKDGRIDQKEIAESRRRLKLITEGPRNGKGILQGLPDPKESRERAQLMKQYDRDGDGKLNQYELRAAGAKMMVDSNGDGKFASNEAQDIRNVSTRSGNFQMKGLNYDLQAGNALLRGSKASQGASQVSRLASPSAYRFPGQFGSPSTGHHNCWSWRNGFESSGFMMSFLGGWRSGPFG